MKSWSASYFTILFFASIARLHAPDGIEESLTAANEKKPELSESPKPVTKTDDPKLSTSPDDLLTQSQEISSSMSSATLELEEFVTPTVAPATPSYDTESSSPIINSSSSIESYAKASSGYVLASVILIPPSNPGQIQSSQGSQGAKVNKESVNTESAVPTKEPDVLSSFLDSTPPANPISSEPMPTPPTTTTAKEEEDSITAALKQAEEESKPKEEEMPSFDEFKRRVLQEEEEKSKQLISDNASGTAQKPKKVKERKQSNYASVDCGAKILDHNSEASNADSILVENKDLYMLNPCSAQVWFVVELCDVAQVKSIQIANFELFSSTPESFRVSVSTRYPTREWSMLGTFQAREEREIQTFPLDEPIYAKYFKVEMLSHFGSEHYCPLSLLRVHGSSMMEELEDHETDGQEDNDNADSDSDVPVLPPEPGANVEDEAKKQNLLERAADTVISLVKKFTGNGHDKEKGDDIQGAVDSELDTVKSSNGVVTNKVKSDDENKGKLVTLVGHEELKESPEDQSSSSDIRNTSQGTSALVNKSDEGSSWFEEVNSQKDSATTSVALSPCQLFSQLIGQYSLGCFMGRLLFSKNKNFTLSLGLSKRQNIKLPNKTSSSIDAKEKIESIENKESDGQDNFLKTEEPIQEKPSVTESSEEGNTPSQAENQKFSTFTPEPSSSKLELKSENTVSQNLQFVENTSTSSRTVKPSLSIDSLQNSEVSDDRTPALEEVSVVTSVPLNSTQSASLSLALQSSKVQESKESVVETVKEDLGVDNQQGVDEQIVQTPLPSSQSTVVNEQPVSEIKDSTPQPQVASKPPDVPSESEGQGEKIVSDKDKQEDKDEQKSEPAPSECVSPNSIHLVSQSSPDIDVLETKLTDKDGREGTAQLREEMHVNLEKGQLPSVNGATISEVVINSASVIIELADRFNEEAVSSGVQDQERNSDSTESSSTTVDSQSIDPTVQPTSPPAVDTPDISDSIAPLPAPPVTREASLSSLEVVTTSPDSNLDAGMLSKVQQAATSSAGMASVTGSGLHKESIFVRLSNKIKALEQNLNMSTLYMEQLNQRYRKSLDELQKNSDKKVALLTNATKKAEAVINSQKEQITKLQSKLDNLTDVIADMKARMDPLNKEVMERHIIGLCIEIVLILVLFLMFARRRNNQEIPDSPRRAGAFMNGHGPPRLAIEDGRHYHDDMMDPAVSLSVREQLVRSFGNTSDPETIGANAATESLDNKLCKADSYNPSESKRRRNRKRKASSTTDLPQDSPGVSSSNKPEPTHVSQSCTDTPSPASLVSRTAGLLFFGARGFFGGFQNPWKQKKPTAVHSEPDIVGRSESNFVNKASFRSNNQGITRAKSLDSVPEEAVSRGHVPPPPPPPLPPEFGVIFKRPPDCYYSKKGNVKNVTSGAMKYGKYGVLDTQLA